MFFKDLKLQLLVSSIAAVILTACFIALAANGFIVASVILACLIGAYIIAVRSEERRVGKEC